MTDEQKKTLAILQKRFHITAKEYTQTLTQIRKANKKGELLAKSDTALKSVKFSYRLEKIKDREDLTRLQHTIASVLEDDYEAQTNQDIRDRFISNITTFFTPQAADIITSKINAMTDSQFKTFLFLNSDIDILAYDSDKELISQFLEIADENATKMLYRLK